MITHASLFSGIGGFDLAAEWAGFTNIFQVEKDEFCQQVLKKNFPNTDKYYDIKKFNGTKYRGTIDVLTGGFPCQPFSQAGKRKGTADDRHLFPEMLRVISEIKPQWVIAENVYGFLNIQGGLVFEQACLELENLDYEVQTFIIPACGVNAWHKRDRVWIVANSRCEYGTKKTNKRTITKQNRQENAVEPERPIEGDRIGIVADTDTKGLERGNWTRMYSQYNRGDFSWGQNWIEVATELCGDYNGLPAELDGFKLSKSKHRIERLKSLGNAIVPQVAEQIFKNIKKAIQNT